MEKLLHKLVDKLNSEWNNYYNSLMLLSKQDIVSKAYEISHYAEVYDFLVYLDPDCWCPFDENFITRLLEYKGSILKNVYDTWIDLCNPEKFNFFAPDGLVDIIWFAFHRSEGEI